MLRSPSLPPVEMGNLNAALHEAVTETVTLDKTSPAVGKNLGELGLRGKTGATVIAVVQEGETKVSPGANFKLCEGDTILLSGSAEKIERAAKLLQPNEGIEGFNP